MTTNTTETPDGERLARLETRYENLERATQDIREDIRGLREDNRDLRKDNLDLRNKIDRQFMWIVGIIITMWITLVVMWVTSMLALLNRLGG